jgi:bifunctional non-homologous end joining protein LigD
VPKRSRDWLKVKCAHGQELVIGGWTAPRGARERLGALLVGYYEQPDDAGAAQEREAGRQAGGKREGKPAEKLRYAGKVGTGFDRRALQMLGDRLERLERATSPFEAGGPPRGARWAEPELVAEIGFAEWTRDGKLRQPRYQGLRDDKAAGEVVREVAS